MLTQREKDIGLNRDLVPWRKASEEFKEILRKASKVQYFHDRGDCWVDTDTPLWCPGDRYRVHPDEPVLGANENWVPFGKMTEEERLALMNAGSLDVLTGAGDWYTFGPASTKLPPGVICRITPTKEPKTIEIVAKRFELEPARWKIFVNGEDKGVSCDQTMALACAKKNYESLGFKVTVESCLIRYVTAREESENGKWRTYVDGSPSNMIGSDPTELIEAVAKLLCEAGYDART